MAAMGLAQVANLELNSVSILQAHTVTLPISVNVVPQNVTRDRVPDADEIKSFTRAFHDLERRETGYTSRKLSADWAEKSRGYRDREQGGEWEST